VGDFILEESGKLLAGAVQICRIPVAVKVLRSWAVSSSAGPPPLLRLYVYDLKAKASRRLAGMFDNRQILGYCWSPDGKQLAYTWRQVHPGVSLAENTDKIRCESVSVLSFASFIVANVEGRNARTVMSARSNRATTVTIESADWK
jgi:Tol biopolymer transport system component